MRTYPITATSASGGTAVPSGAAGGELAGTYPNPTIADGKIDDANIVAAGLTNAAISSSAAIAASKLAAIPESGITNLVTDLAAKAPLASPTFTGTPSLPTGTTATTQSAADGSTKLATTAYVDTADALKANLASPTFTGTPTLPTGTIATTQANSDSSTKVATTAHVKSVTLDTLAAPAADLSINTHKLTNVTDPGADQDAMTKHFLDNLEGNPGMNGLLAQNIPLECGMISTSGALTSGNLYVMRLKVRTAAASGTRTLWVNVSTAGSTLTSSQSLACVFNSSGTQIGSTTSDQSGVWNSTGLKSATVGTFAVAVGDVLYIEVMSNGTTPPVFSGVATNPTGLLNVNLSGANLRAAMNGTSKTALDASITPASLTNPSLTARTIWVGLT